MDTRVAEILKDGLWIECKFEELTTGDTFRLFEPNGELVIGPKKNSVFVCTSNAYVGNESIWMVDVEG
jgi:hypothetical protein